MYAPPSPPHPTAWQEQETYISELENQDRVPDGKEVVHPIAGFVLKTKFYRGSKDQDREKVRCVLFAVYGASQFKTSLRRTAV